MNIPNVSNVLAVEDFSDGKIELKTSLDDKVVSMQIALPCLISMDSDINTPRLPSYKVKKTLKEDAVRFLSFADFDDQNADNYGLSGSATQVERIFPPEKTTSKQVVDGDAENQSDVLFNLLNAQKLL